MPVPLACERHGRRQGDCMRTRKLDRKEKVALVLVVAIAAAAFAIPRLYTQSVKDAVEEFDESVRYEFPAGETMHLDTREDEKDISPTGMVHGGGFTWEGAMDVRILSADLYNSSEDAGIPEDELAISARPGTFFLLCAVEVENIDAVVPQSSDYFNISFLRAEGAGGDIAYFDGSESIEGPKNGYCFILPPGEKQVYQVGYIVYEEPTGYFQVGSTGKYTTSCEVTDKRTEAAA